ncbi:MAG: NAD(+) synthase [Bacteroidales bacterium]|nr:NAD(+) synthase [Bacteroidales bacterium]
MKDYGFIRTAAAVPEVKIADTRHNGAEICRLAEIAADNKVSIIVFPELSLTGASCGDLFAQEKLIKGAEDGIREIIGFSRGKTMTILVGAPVPYRSRLYNCAIVIRNGNIKGIVPKIYTDTATGFHFASGRDFLSAYVRNDGAFLNNGKDCSREGFCGEIRYAGQKCNISPNLMFSIGNATFAIEIGEDQCAPIPVSVHHALQGAQLILCPAASSEILMSDRRRKELLGRLSAGSICGYIHATAGYGESTQKQIFAGAASIWENGNMLAENERFQMQSSLITADVDIERLESLRRKSPVFMHSAPDGTDASSYYRLYNRINLGQPSATDFEQTLYRYIEPHPFNPSGDIDYRCKEIISMQVLGLATRLKHIGCRTAVLGISGGLDSTLALLVTVLAADRLGWEHERIVAVTMPGFGTTSRTKNNAWDLMEALGVTCREIPIGPAVEQHFKDISHDPSVHDATYENSQARERTQILMDIANQTGGIVIGTGDLSELALGWATYNGDHMSMYGVNAGIPKTLVRSLVIWAAEKRFNQPSSTSKKRNVKDILLDIADTPISPELLPADANGEIAQVTEDLVGPYELHDFFLYNFMRFGYTPDKLIFLACNVFEKNGSYDKKTIQKWLKIFMQRFFSQQFKRSCMPDGPKVGSISLSPRGDWDMPSDAWSRIFTEDLA